MSIIVKSSAELATALKVAKAGDVIQLTSGTYTMTAANLQFGAGVTVTSADLSKPAVITNINITGSGGITVRDLELRVEVNRAFQVRDSKNINFERLDVHGSLDGNPQNDQAAFSIQNSQNVSVVDSEFQQLNFAVGHLNVDGLTVSGNNFHDIRLDGVRGGGSSNVAIIENRFTDFFPAAGDHSDAIQFWTTNTTANTHDILIADNLFLRGAGSRIQGIFFGDEVAGRLYEGVTIEGNLISGAAYHGITLESARDVVVKDNIVQGYTDLKSWLRLDNITNATVTDNKASVLTITANNTNLTQSGNSIVALASDKGAAALAEWTAAHSGANPPSTPPPTVPTGVSLVGGRGDEAFTGGAGNDTIDGGGGDDSMTGGAGNDVYVASPTDVINEAAGGGIDTVKSASFYTLPANLENLEITGTSAFNGAGNELANLITGNAAANKLKGLDGADTLSGAAGADTLIGGLGVDRFVFSRGGGKDVISDFGAGGHDVIDISAHLSAGVVPTLVASVAGVTIRLGADEILVAGADLSSLHATTEGYVF